MSNKELLKKVYDYIGHENFIQLVDTLNNKCIDELGLKDSENCEKEPNDKRDICGECIANALKDLEFNVTDFDIGEIVYVKGHDGLIHEAKILKFDPKLRLVEVMKYSIYGFGTIVQWIDISNIIKK